MKIKSIKQMIEDDLIIFPSGEGGVPRQKKFLTSYRNKTKAIVSNLGWFSTENATTLLMNLFDGKKIFNFPKPISLIKKLIEQSTNNDDIILDFFAGSGTTAHAVMELNKEDGGKRKFIMVQWDEKIPEKNAAYNFCQENKLAPVISSICIERIKRAGEKIKQEADLLNDKLDVGYKVFSLTERPRLQGSEQSELKLDNKRTTYEDTLYNMLVASCKKTTAAITEIEKGRLYQVEGDYYVLGQCQKDLTSIKSQYLYIDGYAEIKLENWLNMLGLDKENVEIIY